MSPAAVIRHQDNCAVVAQTYASNSRGARVCVAFYIFCCRIDCDRHSVGMLRRRQLRCRHRSSGCTRDQDRWIEHSVSDRRSGCGGVSTLRTRCRASHGGIVGNRRWVQEALSRRYAHRERFSPYLPLGRILPVLVYCPAERLEPDRMLQRRQARPEVSSCRWQPRHGEDR